MGKTAVERERGRLFSCHDHTSLTVITEIARSVVRFAKVVEQISAPTIVRLGIRIDHSYRQRHRTRHALQRAALGSDLSLSLILLFTGQIGQDYSPGYTSSEQPDFV